MAEQSPPQSEPVSSVEAFGDLTRYNALMDVVRNRMTTRQFDPRYTVPRAHYELILEAARHGPSGANAQPWHYIVVTNPETKGQIADYFVDEQRKRAKLRMKFPTPNYRGLETAPASSSSPRISASPGPFPCWGTALSLTACDLAP